MRIHSTLNQEAPDPLSLRDSCGFFAGPFYVEHTIVKAGSTSLQKVHSYRSLSELVLVLNGALECWTEEKGKTAITQDRCLIFPPGVAHQILWAEPDTDYIDVFSLRGIYMRLFKNVGSVTDLPKEESAKHYHGKGNELYFVHKGRLSVAFNGAPSELVEKDMLLYIESKKLHKISYVAPRTDLVVFASSDFGDRVSG